MRTPHVSVCTATAAAVASLVLAPAAFAAGPGPNEGGTVKIHDAATDEVATGSGDSDPRVCGFFLDAFGFQGVQRIAWKIVGVPPTDDKGTVAETGALVLDGNGHGTTDDLAVADGHYKLVWNLSGKPDTGGHKVFWADCENGAEPGDSAASPSRTATSAAPGSPEPGGTASTEPSSGASVTVASPSSPSAPSSAGATSAAPSAEESPNGGAGDDDLATTGSGTPVGAITTAAAILLGAGAYLALRHRNSRP